MPTDRNGANPWMASRSGCARRGREGTFPSLWPGRLRSAYSSLLPIFRRGFPWPPRTISFTATGDTFIAEDHLDVWMPIPRGKAEACIQIDQADGASGADNSVAVRSPRGPSPDRLFAPRCGLPCRQPGIASFSFSSLAGASFPAR
jgi:hypothetical protein